MSKDLNGSGAGLGQLTTPTRNLYPYGKLLTGYFFELEQWYLRLQLYLHSRLTLGSGVVCGLQVLTGEDGIRVGPGVAIDPLGRPIVVPQTSPPVDPRQATDDCGAAQGTPMEGAGTITLCLAYHECEAELVPLLVSECECEQRCAASTVRERYALVVRAGAPEVEYPACELPAIFSAAADPTSIHARLVERISQACPGTPSETCVVLAQLSLPSDGGPVTTADIDITPRPLVVGNELLLELLLCLAARVEACCDGAATKTEKLVKTAGDEQTGPAGEVLPEPLAVRVLDENDAPVSGEPVTFTVTGGGGAVSTGGPFMSSAVVSSAADGGCSIEWRLGGGGEANEVRASLSSGASVLFHATVAPKLAPPPIVTVVWPPNAAKLEPEGPEEVVKWWQAWRERPRLELSFDREMNSDQLKAPNAWLRMWLIRVAGKTETIRPVKLSLDTSPTPPVLGDSALTATYRIPAAAVKGLEGSVRFVIEIRAEAGNIGDAEPTPQLLDADFAGTELNSALLNELWGTSIEKTESPPQLWNELAGSAATVPSGNGIPGGVYHGYFEVTF